MVVSESDNGSTEFSDLTDEILARLLKELESNGSALLEDDLIRAQFLDQVRGVLYRAFGTGTASDAVARNDPEPGTRMGVTRARQSVHPRESLAAAGILFDVAATVVGERPARCADSLDFARALNHEIIDTLVPASIAYVNVLLERLAIAHAEERRRISRDLHDRVAHDIAAALQETRRVQRASLATDLSGVLASLEAAQEHTAALALDLRQTVGEGLDAAVHSYIAGISHELPKIAVLTIGSPTSVPAGVQEEALMIVREAIRNARQHAAAETINVTMEWAENGLRISVVDDGQGFQRDAIRPGALGLASALERAQLIGAELLIRSEPYVGTHLQLYIPARARLP